MRVLFAKNAILQGRAILERQRVLHSGWGHTCPTLPPGCISPCQLPLLCPTNNTQLLLRINRICIDRKPKKSHKKKPALRTACLLAHSTASLSWGPHSIQYFPLAVFPPATLPTGRIALLPTDRIVSPWLYFPLPTGPVVPDQ